MRNLALVAETQVAESREAKLERALSIANAFVSRVISSSQRGADDLPLEIANDALHTKQQIAKVMQNAER